jgi:putative transposase
LAALLGADAPNLSPGVITRLTAGWQEDYDSWQRRDLSARSYVYIWADGSTCRLAWSRRPNACWSLIGATPEGSKELLGFQVGVRESAQSWRELLVDLKARGLRVSPKLAVGDSALGFWKALEEAFPGTRHQRCWFHKMSNALNYFPKSMQPAVTADLREEKYGAKYARRAACLTKDTEALLAFYDFPAEHWDHLRTSTPIESVFVTVCHRTVRTKGALSQKTAKLMVFTLVRAASKTWRKLNGTNRLPSVIEGVKFTDGVAHRDTTESRAA